MNLLQGILLAPNEEFSFNDNVGNINAANGFVEGYAIVQNRTQLEFGGGICQDSTTMFRAAFWAGLPITDRKEHSFYISWYDKYGLGDAGNGPGLDATIFTGAQDFRFLNDTGHWMLIQTYVDEKRTLAEVRMYGTKPNRTVTLTSRVYDRKPMPPEAKYLPDPKIPRGTRKQSDKGRGGMTIDVYRTITENGVARSPELFRTVFRPWPNIYLYNPADIGSDGRPVVATAVPTVVPGDPSLPPVLPPDGAAPPVDGVAPPLIEPAPAITPVPESPPAVEPTPQPQG
jgi:hypothetical protein